MSKKTKFPVLAVILLIFAIAWLLESLGYLATKLPWIPIMLIIVAIGMIFNRFKK